jgi:hypothetical protein
MAELPSPDDDDHRGSRSSLDIIFDFLSKTTSDDGRTKNLILLVLSVVVPAVVALIVLAFALVVAVKGVHVLENRGVWVSGGLIGGPSLVRIVIWFRRRHKCRAVSGDAAAGEQPAPPSVERSHSQIPQGRIPQQAQRSRPRKKPRRRR